MQVALGLLLIDMFTKFFGSILIYLDAKNTPYGFSVHLQALTK